MGGNRRRRRLRLASAALLMLFSTALFRLAKTTTSLGQSSSGRQTSKDTSQERQQHPHDQLQRTCRPSPGTADWTYFPSHYPLTQLVELLNKAMLHSIPDPTVTNITTTNLSPPSRKIHAVCKFRKQGRNFWSTQSLWQQITRCASFWQQPFFVDHHEDGMNNKNNNDPRPTEAVFFTGPHIPRHLPEVRDMLELLQEALHVRIIHSWSALPPEGTVLLARPLFFINPLEDHPYQGYTFTDAVQADRLHQTVGHYYGVVDHTSHAPPAHPRIVLLASPRIVNLDALRTDWQVALGQSVTILAASSLTQASLGDQIRALSSVNILVALHDLALTPALLWGLPACAGVLEVFPPYYYTPHVHGRLAASRGLSYAALYTGQDVQTEWYADGGGLHNQSLRHVESRTPVCLPTNASVTVLRRLTEEWRTCRQQRVNAVRITSTATASSKAVAPAPVAVSYADRCLTLGHPEAVVTHYPTHMALDDLVQDVVVEGTATVPVDQSHHPDERAAVCVYAEQGFYGHFPHAMQQFTRCFSFWQSYPDHQPYFLWPDGLTIKKTSSDFINSVRRQIFGAMFGVIEIGHPTEIPPGARVVEPRVYTGFADDNVLQGIPFANTDHSQLWRQTVQQHWNLTTAGCPNAAGVTTTTTTTARRSARPVIGILNRTPQSKRQLINVDALRERLRPLTDRPIAEVFFEEASYRQQVEILSQIDIIISPHGAQLTSMHYMPECGGVRLFCSCSLLWDRPHLAPCSRSRHNLLSLSLSLWISGP
jgi:hypothetical protein